MSWRTKCAKRSSRKRSSDPAGFLDPSGGVRGCRNHPSLPGCVRSMVKKERRKDGTRAPHPRLAGGGRSKHCHVVFPHPFLPTSIVMRSYEGRAGKDRPPAKSDPGLCLRYRFHSNFHVKSSMVAMCKMDMVLTLLKGLAAHSSRGFRLRPPLVLRAPSAPALEPAVESRTLPASRSSTSQAVALRASPPSMPSSPSASFPYFVSEK